MASSAGITTADVANSVAQRNQQRLDDLKRRLCRLEKKLGDELIRAVQEHLTFLGDDEDRRDFMEACWGPFCSLCGGQGCRGYCDPAYDE